MDKALELSKKYKTLLNKYGVNTPLRLAHFFAQIAHESNLKPIEENLNYSESGLLKTFSKYFTKEQAKLYARKPQKIGSRVYANRMGNGDERSSDGYKYRGRGFIQLTGKNNYRALGNAVKVNYLENPDLLLNEADAMIAALWFWDVNKLNPLADKDDILTITKRINGGTNGLTDRKNKLKHYKQIFK